MGWLSDNMWALSLRPLITRAPAPLLAGSLLLAAVLLSAGVWSWLAASSAPRLGTWTVTGTVIQLIGDPPISAYIGSGESPLDYTLDLGEFDSAPQIEEGDQVTVWVAAVQETAVSPFWGTAEIVDRHIIRLQSQRGAWTVKDYSYRVAAARAAAQPGFGMNFQTVRWVGLIAGVLVALFVLVSVQARSASATSGKGAPGEHQRPPPGAGVAHFSRSDREVLGCSLALALAVLAAAALVAWLLVR